MKILAQMNRVVRISTIAVILCIAITGGSLIYKHNTAHACGSSIIRASTTSMMTPNGTTIIFSLWYNSCTQQNFTSANITVGSLSGMTVTVHRNSGPDGLDIENSNNNCPSHGICNSPGVYSPDNTSYAQIWTSTGFIWSSSF